MSERPRPRRRKPSAELESRLKILRAPIALTSEGDLVLNVLELDLPAELEIDGLGTHRAHFFVGILLGREEVRTLMNDLALVLPNVTAPIAGARLRRQRAGR